MLGLKGEKSFSLPCLSEGLVSAFSSVVLLLDLLLLLNLVIEFSFGKVEFFHQLEYLESI